MKKRCSFLLLRSDTNIGVEFSFRLTYVEVVLPCKLCAKVSIISREV